MTQISIHQQNPIIKISAQDDKMQANVTSPELTVTPLIACLDNSREFEHIQYSLNHIINQTIKHHPILATREENKALADLLDHAEQLKSMSVELLMAEQRARELSSLESIVSDEYELREQAYLQRIEECEQVSRQQSEMIETLAELSHQLEPKRHRDSFMTTTTWQSSQDSLYPSTCNTSVHSMSNLSKYEHDPKDIRYRISIWLGGCVGTGKVIHAFDNQEGIRECLVAGSGLVSSFRYNYLFHIHSKERNRFRQMSKTLWTPDSQVNQCQDVTCCTRFSFTQRRHHCRKCGKIVCHKHSLNKLPLFSSNKQATPTWSRTCNVCFTDLILFNRV